MLCVYFRENQQASIAPVARIAVIIYQRVFLLFHAAAMPQANAISISVATALTTASAGKYGERRWIYETEKLIYQNVRSDVQEVPHGYTQTQFKILCRLIQQKKVTEQFFNFLLESLFELKDQKQLSYEQMYELIHVLTFWNYQTEAEKERV